MLRRVLLLSCTLIHAIGFAQLLTPETVGFEAFQLQDEELGEVNYYLSKSDSSKPLPLLVYLDGSGHYPLFQKMPEGLGSTVVIDFQNLSEQYRILLISKPGIPFCDSLSVGDYGMPDYDAPPSYTERFSLDWRVNATHRIIDQVITTQPVDTGKVIVFGFSEGAQVGPFVARKNEHVTHALLFAGNGLSQMIDPIINARLKAASGQLSEEEAQHEVDSLFTQYALMFQHPNTTDSSWWGHSYKRWTSFDREAPYRCMLELDIPIYFANGSLDDNSVISADYIKLEFIKAGKQNLTYRTYPGLDHGFDELIFENGEFIEARPHLSRVLNDAFEWLSAN